MPARSIASLSLTFGLVSIPIKLYSATESSAAIRFKWMASSGARVRQQYVAEIPLPVPEEQRAGNVPAPERERIVAQSRGPNPKLVEFPTTRKASAQPPDDPVPQPSDSVLERSTMLKGYEYERGKFVLFTPEELRALEAGSRKTIDIISFIPENAVEPIYYDKAYLLAPDKRGSKPYNLLLRAMRDTHRCALGKWAFRSKEYVAQIRAAKGGIVLQQLLYAEEVRSFADLHIEPTDVGDAELKLAKQLIERISVDSYDPSEFADEERQRILAAVAEKVAGKKLASPSPIAAAGGQVIDLLQALRASLDGAKGAPVTASGPSANARKPARRATPQPAGSALLSKKARPSKR
jgi:DNA end-binding protein Ku